jgi:outer membrane receptor protein involved in Fe transport
MHFGAAHAVTAGLQVRSDFISPVGLHRSRGRVRTGTIREDEVEEWSTGAFLEAQSTWRPWLRTTLGVRGDGYLFDVSSDRRENSGRETAGIVSPKGSIVIAPSGTVEFYLSGGLGFHSNDARGTTIMVDPSTGDRADRVDPLVRSRGAEFGLRSNPIAGWRSTVAVWALELDSELLFIGDGGATEPTDGSRRSGVTWANFYRPIPELSIDADVSLARARFMGTPQGENFIPGALENVVAGGVTWNPLQRGVFGAIRVRHFGSYPLIEDNSVRASATTLLNASAGFKVGNAHVQLGVLNLLNRRANDIQYYYRSRLPGETGDGVSDIHFHPVEPRQLRISLGWGLQASTQSH